MILEGVMRDAASTYSNVTSVVLVLFVDRDLPHRYI
jgi:hypothetical protein